MFFEFRVFFFFRVMVFEFELCFSSFELFFRVSSYRFRVSSYFFFWGGGDVWFMNADAEENRFKLKLKSFMPLLYSENEKETAKA